jgi:ribosomal protein S18 acetylase RimI-like enzyme
MGVGVSQFVIRSALNTDVDAIAALWHAGWSEAHIGRVPQELLAHRDARSFRQRVPIRLATTTVAVADGVLAGFVVTHNDEIEQLYVAAPFRGTGVAATLLTTGESVIRAMYDKAWLAVVDGNVRARRFYERQGWHDSGTFGNPAWTTEETTILVPCRRYEKRLTESTAAHKAAS